MYVHFQCVALSPINSCLKMKHNSLVKIHVADHLLCWQLAKMLMLPPNLGLRQFGDSLFATPSVRRISRVKAVIQV
jgi:hypothetical protein